MMMRDQKTLLLVIMESSAIRTILSFVAGGLLGLNKPLVLIIGEEEQV